MENVFLFTGQLDIEKKQHKDTQESLEESKSKLTASFLGLHYHRPICQFLTFCASAHSGLVKSKAQKLFHSPLVLRQLSVTCKSMEAYLGTV